MKTLLIILLLPITAVTQFVDPVISKDYLEKIKDSSQSKEFINDTTSNARNASLLLNKAYYGYEIQKINIRHGYLNIQRAFSKTLFITGNFTSAVEIKKINQLPALQDQYVQGRAINGNLAWHGAETNELFSYGPAINTLEFDGSNYLYDINGKLVPFNSGNGKKANAYRNNIFRTAGLTSQSLMIQGRYLAKGNQYLTRIKLGQSRENTFIKQNRNTSQNFSGLFEAAIKRITVSATYSTLANRFTNSNRNGFLNRIYQNSILTPTSFDNSQGSAFGNTQRSYSNAADNPYFLLENNDNSFFQSYKTGSLVIEKKQNKFKFRVAQSVENVNEKSDEAYKPGTAFFPAGIFVNRNKKDANYFLTASASYETRYDYSDFRSTISVNYILGNTHSVIDYSTKAYRYQRTSNDVDLNYLTSYDGYNFDAGIRLENKMYATNTVIKDDLFLPGVSGYIHFDDIFNADGLGLKLISNLNNFNSELPINTSLSQTGLTRYSTDQALQYFPLTEVSGFDNVFPIRHKEWTARTEFNYKYKITLQAEVFDRKITDDIFPVYANGSLDLKNIASHRNRGFELTTGYYSHAKKITTSHSVSFFSYNDIVTDVKDGYNFTPIAGFGNINKAIVKGGSLGAIVGNKFLQDESGQTIIGNNGYPLVDPNTSVIGDPIPDFVMKFSSNITWKRFSLNLDWEWKKGGNVWNGTQAVLDYYGRSKTTAELRNVTAYVFAGITEDKHVNDIPVNFYDANSSLDENRWVRYGYTGVAKEYIQRADFIRINNLAVNYKLTTKKYIQNVSFTLNASNLFIWKAYKGTDPNQLLYDQPGTNGLDFFNLPSVKYFGLSISIQF